MNEFYLKLAKDAGFVVEGDKVVGDATNIKQLLELFKQAMAEY